MLQLLLLVGLDRRVQPLAGAVDSLDPEGTARLYSTLKPRIEDAYAELGRDRSFDVALERAFVAMLQTPALDGEGELAERRVLRMHALRRTRELHRDRRATLGTRTSSDSRP